MAEGRGETQIKGVERCLKRWPMLPLLSIGFWTSWQFMIFSGTLPVSVSGNPLAFYLTMLILCFCAIARPSLFHATSKAPFAIGCGLICSLGTALLFASSADLPLSANTQSACLLLGSILSGIGMTCIALNSCELLSRLNPTNIWIWLAYSELLVVSLYFTAAGIGYWGAAAILLLLPLLSALCLYLGDRPGTSLEIAKEERQRLQVPNGVFAKLALFVALCSVASSFARLVSTDLFASLDLSLAWPAAARVILAMAIIVSIAFVSKRFPFSQLCMFVALITLLVFAYTPFSSQANPLLFFMTTLSYGTLECITLAMAACLSFKTARNPRSISALFFITLYGGSGLVSGIDAYGQSAGLPLAEILFPVTAVISIAFAVFFVQDHTYNNLLGSIEDFERGLNFASPKKAEGTFDAAEKLASLSSQYSLSPRERELVAKLQGGSSVGSIADSMGLSIHTVRGYIHNIYTKCEVHSRDELVQLFDKSPGQN